MAVVLFAIILASSQIYHLLTFLREFNEKNPVIAILYSRQLLVKNVAY